MCSLEAISKPSANTKIAWETPDTSWANLETSQSRESRCVGRVILESVLVRRSRVAGMQPAGVHATEVVADAAADGLGVARDHDRAGVERGVVSLVGDV